MALLVKPEHHVRWTARSSCMEKHLGEFLIFLATVDHP